MPPTSTKTTEAKRREHSCKICHKAFVRFEHLQRHQLSHENRKTNECKGCSSKFARSDVLRRHTRKCAEFQQIAAPEATLSTSTNVSDIFAEDNLGQQDLNLASQEVTVPVNTGQTTSAPGHSVLANPHSLYGQPMRINSARSQDQLLIDPSAHQQPPSSPASLDPRLSLSLNMQLGRHDFQASAGIGFHDSNTHGMDSSGMVMEELAGDAAFQNANLSQMNMNLDEDLTFLEDIFLPKCTFNNRSFQTPVLPLGNSEKPDEPSYIHFLVISREDVAEFQKRVVEANSSRPLTNFQFPRQSRIIRCLTAYFECFDPHAPIIQHATFSLCGTSPALVLAILAIGALYSNEHNFAKSAYDAACTLLDEFVGNSQTNHSSDLELWPIQAFLLSVQFGAFSDNDVFARRSQHQFAAASKMLRSEILKVKASGSEEETDWASWSLIQTVSRLASWTCVLSAVILAKDPMCIYLAPYQLWDVPLPHNEDLWRARSSQEWNFKRSMYLRYSTLEFSSLTKFLLRGEPISDNIRSSFGLLSLIGWILSSICHHEKLMMSMGPIDVFGSDFTTKMGLALSAWEVTFRRYRRTDQVVFRPTDPLLSDSFALLGSAYYHLYVGDELRTLKEIAEKASGQDIGSVARELPPFRSPSSMHKAVRYAATSLFLRSKVGLGHFQYLGPVNYAGYVHTTMYEGALILSWWLAVSQPPRIFDQLGDRDGGDGGDAGKPLEDILSEFFAEVEDQDIPCDDHIGRVLAPLIFSRQCIHQCIYTYSESIQRKLDAFIIVLRQRVLGDRTQQEFSAF